MTMKKVILSSVMAVAAISSMNAAHATSQSICAAPTAAGNGTAPTVGSFIKTAFTPKCSANVYLVGDDQNTYYGAGSASAKGKNIFRGSTAGGGVAASGSCAATGCVSGDAVTAATTAPAS